MSFLILENNQLVFVQTLLLHNLLQLSSDHATASTNPPSPASMQGSGLRSQNYLLTCQPSTYVHRWFCLLTFKKMLLAVFFIYKISDWFSSLLLDVLFTIIFFGWGGTSSFCVSLFLSLSLLNILTLVWCCCSFAQLCPIFYDPMDGQHARLSCPLPSPRVCWNSCPLSRWCHPTIPSVAPLLLLPSIFSSIRVFSNELALHLGG